MSNLFISHSSKNNFHAIAIRDWLFKQGWKELFLDLDSQRGIVPAEKWEKALHEALNRCQAVLFLVSHDWLESDWCNKEFRLAHKLNKRIIITLIKDIKIESLPEELTSTWQIINLATGTDHQKIDATCSDTGVQQYIYFSKAGLTRLKVGLIKAGLDPKYFQWPPENDPNRSPYRGMLPLEAEDAGIFFGREAPTNELLAKLRGLRTSPAPRLMVVLGASGSGKSSFLRAGILPRLNRDEHHFVTLPIIRPEHSVLRGDNGLLSCLTKICAQYELDTNRATIRQYIKDNPQALTKLLIKLSLKTQLPIMAGETSNSPPTLVLSIDQGEELFHSEGSDQSQVFLRLLKQLLNNSSLPLIILITIRSDSYESLQTHKTLDGIAQQTFSLIPMPQGAYQAIIERPARRLKDTDHPLEIDPALTQRLLQDIEKGGNKDALPILAFTLERLYIDYGSDGDLRLDEYQDMGGLNGAIQAAVEIALHNAERDPTLPNDRKAITDLLRIGLIPGLAGIDPDSQTPRRRIAKLSEIPVEARSVINHFIEQRLLATDTDDDNETTVEPAHESLLRQWALLKNWLKQDSIAINTMDTVQRASKEWLDQNQKHDYLIHTTGRLQDAEELTQQQRFSHYFTPNDWQYLKACRQQEDQIRNKKLSAAKKLVQAQQLQVLAQKKVSRRTKLGMIAAFGLSILAGFFWWQATKEKIRAESNEKIAIQANEETEKAIDSIRQSINFMNFELRDVLDKYVPTTHRVNVTKSLDKLLELIQVNTSSDDDKRNIAVALLNKIELMLASDEMNPSEVLTIAKQAHEIFIKLLQKNPNNSQFKRDLTLSYDNIAKIQLRLGKTEEALALYQQALEIRKKLIELDGNNSQFKRDLTVSYNKVADIQLRLGKTEEALALYQQSLEIAKKLIELDGNNSQFKRDLTVSYDNIAKIQLRLGKTEEALALYQQALEIAKKLIELDGNNSQFKRDLLISYHYCPVNKNEMSLMT